MKNCIISAGVSVRTAVTLVFATAPAASAATPTATLAVASSTQSFDDRAAGLASLLQQATAVPDEVLFAGDEATHAWLQENGPATQDGTVSTKASVLGCAGSTAVALAGVAFPAAKLLKIKKLADELGGVKKAVDLLWGASFNYEKVQAAGGALASLGAELIGIASFKEQCFE